MNDQDRHDAALVRLAELQESRLRSLVEEVQRTGRAAELAVRYLRYSAVALWVFLLFFVLSVTGR
ncbi:MAG: hypothetical protein H6831_08075 [Planctomycetes bacterium]|nr:hypothetical protein [Planctomycetota bacterium]MCB9904348.1 hypothetical protein [Planctomycetota bacterium]